MQSLTEYMKKELIFYIKQEYDKGIPLSSIKKSLLEGGHHTDLVKEALVSLKKNGFNLVKALNDPIKKNLDKELYFNIMNSLVKYIEHQLSEGKSVDEIKKILAHYGHSDKVIKEAVSRVQKKTPSELSYLRYLDFGIMIAVIVLIFLVAGSSREPLENVFLGFLPVVLTIVAANLSAEKKLSRSIIWFFPGVFSLAFFLLAYFGVIGVSGMDYFKLTVFDFIVSLAYTAVRLARTKGFEKSVEIVKEEISTDSDKEVKEPEPEELPEDKAHKKRKAEE